MAAALVVSLHVHFDPGAIVGFSFSLCWGLSLISILGRGLSFNFGLALDFNFGFALGAISATLDF